jgi:hypothetical protein
MILFSRPAAAAAAAAAAPYIRPQGCSEDLFTRRTPRGRQTVAKRRVLFCKEFVTSDTAKEEENKAR